MSKGSPVNSASAPRNSSHCTSHGTRSAPQSAGPYRTCRNTEKSYGCRFPTASSFRTPGGHDWTDSPHTRAWWTPSAHTARRHACTPHTGPPSSWNSAPARPICGAPASASGECSADCAASPPDCGCLSSVFHCVHSVYCSYGMLLSDLRFFMSTVLLPFFDFQLFPYNLRRTIHLIFFLCIQSQKLHLWSTR